MRYEDLTYMEIANKIKEGFSIIIPTGCTEQQGPHLNVDFDTWFASELMNEVARVALEKYELKLLVAPVIPFGPSSEHINYGSGYVHIPQELYEKLIYSILDSFEKQEFRNILIWRGCGGHYIDNCVEDFVGKSNRKANVVILPQPFHEIWSRFAPKEVPGGHADSFATSVALYKAPQRVRKDMIFNPNNSEPDWNNKCLDFKKYSSTGVIGDPTHASRELGEVLWLELVENVIQTIKMSLVSI